MKVIQNSRAFIMIVILVLLAWMGFMFIESVNSAADTARKNSSTNYKYKIQTQSATYYANELQCSGNGQIGFRNSNGEYVEIK